MTNETFDEGMAEIMAVFPSLQPNEMTLKVWRQLLLDLEDDSFLKGVRRLCLEVREFYPNTNIVALIREYASGGKEALRNRALMAWQEVLKAVQTVGTYQSVCFQDPVIHSCIEALDGWVALGRINRDELVWTEKKFMELYPAYAARKDHPVKLVGMTELHNSAIGFMEDIPDPIMIGPGGEPLKALPDNVRRLPVGRRKQ